jgi:hypothetical protein
MKKGFFTVIAACAVLSSCGPSKDDYNKAAKKMCDCMQKKNVENEELKALNIDLTDANFAVCALEMAEKNGINPVSDDFGAAIAEKCPDLKEAHANYVKTAKKLTQK